MFPARFLYMCKFRPIIGLDDFWFIAEESNGFFDEINGRIAALLHIGIKKAFSGSLINDGILIKLLWDSPMITGGWDIFNIHLPFDTQLGWSIVRFWSVHCFGGRSSTGITQTPINAVKGTGVSFVAFGSTEFTIKFADGDFGITAEAVFNPLQFFLCMCIRMRGKRSVGFI